MCGTNGPYITVLHGCIRVPSIALQINLSLQKFFYCTVLYYGAMSGTKCCQCIKLYKKALNFLYSTAESDMQNVTTIATNGCLELSGLG